MSFQICMDGHLSTNIDRNSLSAAAFIGHDGSAWAHSSNFPKFNAEEIKAIVKGFDEPKILVKNGLYLGGTKYIVIQGESGAVINAKQGTRFFGQHFLSRWIPFLKCGSGISVKKTKKALVIGIYEEPIAPEECSRVVEKLGDYLISQGF